MTSENKKSLHFMSGCDINKINKTHYKKFWKKLENHYDNRDKDLDYK